MRLDRRAEAERVGTGDCDARVVDAPHPGHDLPVVEADHELGAHRHGSLDALDDPDDVGRLAPRRHEVDHPDGPVRRLVERLEHERVVAVPASAVRDGRGGESSQRP